jgi:hypothetical protein
MRWDYGRNWGWAPGLRILRRIGLISLSQERVQGDPHAGFEISARSLG